MKKRAAASVPPGLAHDLRSPLHTILGYAAMLRQRVDPAAQEDLAVIEASARRLLRLIGDHAIQADRSEDAAATISDSGYDGRRRTLVVADDEPGNLAVTTYLCRRLGFDVVAAGGGSDALRACLHARPDAALVDQFMPDGDGWQFLRGVRATPDLADLPVILVSAGNAETPEGFPAELSFDAVLTKPFTDDHLARVLDEVLELERRGPASEAAAGEPGEMALPTDADLAEFRALLRLGRVLALEQWADQLAAAKPQLLPFAQRIKDLCGRIDLAGLESLAGLSG